MWFKAIGCKCSYTKPWKLYIFHIAIDIEHNTVLCFLYINWYHFFKVSTCCMIIWLLLFWLSPTLTHWHDLWSWNDFVTSVRPPITCLCLYGMMFPHQWGNQLNNRRVCLKCITECFEQIIYKNSSHEGQWHIYFPFRPFYFTLL